jgi:proteic killer suppression protein
MLLAALDTAHAIDGMDIPEFRLHPLQATKRKYWSIRGNGNWRLAFDFQDGHTYILVYKDYH